MKTKLIPLNESTSPASSVTATTPTAVGGTCGTGKRRARPTARLLQLRKEKKALRAENERMKARLADAEVEADKLQRQLNALVKVRVSEPVPRRDFEIGLSMRLDMRVLDRELPGFLNHAVKQLLHRLRGKLAEAELGALASSPLVLDRDAGAGGRVLLHRKMEWIKGMMFNCQEVRYLPDPYRNLMQIWDEALNAIKAAALAVPEGTKVHWVNEHPREMVWRG